MFASVLITFEGSCSEKLTFFLSGLAGDGFEDERRVFFSEREGGGESSEEAGLFGLFARSCMFLYKKTEIQATCTIYY